MADDIRWQKAPRPWEVVACDARGAPSRIRLGKRQVTLAEVADARIERVAEPNVDAHLMTVGFFMIAGATFVLPVLMNLLEPRFLLGAVLFYTIGLATLGEMRRSRRMELYRIHLVLRAGETVSFATTESGQVGGLVDALAAAGISARDR